MALYRVTSPTDNPHPIVKLRHERNMTQAQLARALRVGQQAVSKWETGASLPSARPLARLLELAEGRLSIQDLDAALRTARGLAPLPSQPHEHW